MKRIPRKLKKKLVREGISPRQYIEQHNSLDVIFNKNYRESNKIIQEAVNPENK